MQTLYVLSRVHAKNPADGNSATSETKVQKVFVKLQNAEAHLRYLRSRYTANGFQVTPIVKVSDTLAPCVIAGLWAYKDYEDESGTEEFRYELTEVVASE